MPFRPSAEDCELLARDGYAIVAGLLDDAACDSLLAQAAALEGTEPRRLLDAEPIARLARELAMHPGLAPLLPRDAVALQCTCFDKSPSRNWSVGPHQDLSLPLPDDVDAVPAGWRGASRKDGMLFAQPPAQLLDQVCAVRLQLDEAAGGDGALEVIPGTHRRGRLGPAELAELAESATRVACRVPRGAALVLHPLLVHGSRKLRTGGRRRVLHFVFAPADIAAPGLAA